MQEETHSTEIFQFIWTSIFNGEDLISLRKEKEKKYHKSPWQILVFTTEAGGLLPQDEVGVGTAASLLTVIVPHCHTLA